MTDFNPEEFLKQHPTPSKLRLLKKKELRELAVHLDIEVGDGSLKEEILAIVLQELRKLKTMMNEDNESGSELKQEKNRIDKEDNETEMSKLELQVRLKELDLAMEREKKEMQIEIETERTKQTVEIERTKQLGLKLEFESKCKSQDDKSSEITKAFNALPKFDEQDVDGYFSHFERTALVMEWPKDSWAKLVQKGFVGKARDAWAALPARSLLEYNVVKEAVLKAYEMVPEAYRQKFRSLRYTPGQQCVDLAKEKRTLLKRWSSACQVKSQNDLEEIILIEEFKNSIPFEVKLFLDQNDIKTLTSAATKADEYLLTKKLGTNQNSTDTRYKGPAGYTSSQPSQTGGPVVESASRSSRAGGPVVYCYRCSKPGHIGKNCPSNRPSHSGPIAAVQGIETDPFEPFLSWGRVSFEGSEEIPVHMLRDTGAAQTLLLSDILQTNGEETFDSFTSIKGVAGEWKRIPLKLISLHSELASGQFWVGIVDHIPIPGVSMLLGNDVAGNKVVPTPIMTNAPIRVDEEEQSDLFPQCAVTRAQVQNKTKEVDQTNSDASKIFHSLPNIDRENFIACQNNDDDLKGVRHRAVDDESALDRGTGYYYKHGVLMRRWRPREAQADESWKQVNQIVVPRQFRDVILDLAHNSPMYGHLGVKKTLNTLWQDFYWPSITRDVAAKCRSCHVCQMVGKPNQPIPKAPLHPIPIVHEPFSRIMLDCVGPLPKTKSGCEYLLTIMCMSSRFPEAIPLRNIKSQNIIKALTKFFTTFGLPKVIQTDQGSNFTSTTFKQVIKTLGIEHITSTAYHPQSQGALERYHQTLKSMMKKYCIECEKQWDEGIHMLLFASRNAVSESLGFSPFELVFGHNVRGPLTVLSEHLVEDDRVVNLLTYVMDFKERLSQAVKLAHENLESSQQNMKTWYDKKARSRSFNVGEKVLVLLPKQGQPLAAAFMGPYTISKRIDDLNYIIDTPDRRKGKQQCHINMLKKYVDDDSHECSTDELQKQVLVAANETNPDNFTGEDLDRCDITGSQITNDVLMDSLSHLGEGERTDIVALIQTFPTVFTQSPGRTNMVEHEIKMLENKPIKQSPYRMSPKKQEWIEQEITKMLEHDIIEPSSSEWSSPVVLVPKANGYRLCVDFRKVNAISQGDGFPIPRVDDCIDRVGNAKFISKFDLQKGYWQMPLAENSKHVTAFSTANNHYQFKVVPFGLKGAPASFQRLMNRVTRGLKSCVVYVDDCVIYSDDWQMHVVRVKEFLQRLEQAGLTLNVEKCSFGQATVMYLGHEVGLGKVAPLRANVESILRFPVPTNKKQLRRFLGLAGFYRKFCRNFSSLTNPLTRLLQAKAEFKWSVQCQEVFNHLKDILSQEPVLKGPDFDLPFTIAVDACDTGIGGVLLQMGTEDVLHPCAYFSRGLKQHQRNYATIEKEALALILSLDHFRVYIECSKWPVQILTDHNPLTFITKMKDRNQRLLRWAIFLQELNVEIHHIAGKKNIIADTLSRTSL